MSGIGTRSARSVERAFTILELLDGSQRMWNISEISRKLKIPKSTTHVLVLSLERMGYLVQSPAGHRYSLGPKVRSFGNETKQRQLLATRSLRHLESLVQDVKLTAHLAVLEEKQAVYIQKLAGPGLIQFDTHVGKRTNLHCTAVGKVLLAYSPPEFIVAFLRKSSLARYTERTITSSAVLRGELDKIRRQGYAVDDEEEELDVRCLAVPILKNGRECIGALGITGTTRQIQPDNLRFLTRVIKQTATSIVGTLSAL